MNGWMFFFTTGVLNFILTLTLQDFYELYFSKCKKKNTIFGYSIIILYYVFSVITVMLSMPGWFNLIVGTTIGLILTLNYKATMYSRLACAFFFMAIINASELITAHLAVLHYDYIFEEFDPSKTGLIYAFFIARIIPYIIIKLIKIYSFSKNKKTYVNSNLNFSEKLIFVFFPLLSIVIMCIFLEISFLNYSNLQTYLAVGMILLSIFIIMFYTLYLKSLELSALRTKEIVMNKHIEDYTLHYEELKENLSAFYTYKHNIKHKLLTILSDNDTNSGEIIKRFNHVFDESLNYIYYSNNKSIDMILNYNVSKAVELGIEAKIKVSQNLKLNIDDKVLSVILGNLLDNSIECLQKNNNKEFSLEIKNQNGNLYLKIINEYHGCILMDNGFPITTKDDKKNHGKGLISIKKLVEDHYGFMNISVDNQIFIVEILLSNKI